MTYLSIAPTLTALVMLQIQPLLAPGNGGAHNAGHKVTVGLSVSPCLHDSLLQTQNEQVMHAGLHVWPAGGI